MGLRDYNYDNEELYYLKNSKTNLYFKVFKDDIPVWVSKKEAISFSEMNALQIQRTLESLYLDCPKVVLVEKDR